MERVTSENINRLIRKFIDQLLEIAKVCQKNLSRPDSNFSIWKVL